MSSCGISIKNHPFVIELCITFLRNESLLHCIAVIREYTIWSFSTIYLK